MPSWCRLVHPKPLASRPSTIVHSTLDCCGCLQRKLKSAVIQSSHLPFSSAFLWPVRRDLSPARNKPTLHPLTGRYEFETFEPALPALPGQYLDAQPTDPGLVSSEKLYFGPATKNVVGASSRRFLAASSTWQKQSIHYNTQQLFSAPTISGRHPSSPMVPRLQGTCAIEIRISLSRLCLAWCRVA